MDPQSMRADYARNGYLIIRGVLDPEAIRRVSDHVQWLQQRNPHLRPEQLHHWLMWEDPFWLGLIADRRLLDCVEPLIGGDIALFASHYICKPGGDGLQVLWHQDGSYWPLKPMDVITVWLAVDASTPENGCMRVLPGSHLGTLLPHRAHQKSAVLGSELPEEQLDTASAVDLVLEPGDISIHHPLLIHGSSANSSPRRRCGLTIRYIPTSTEITRDDWRSFLLRGESRPGINRYFNRPEYDPNVHFGEWKPA